MVAVVKVLKSKQNDKTFLASQTVLIHGNLMKDCLSCLMFMYVSSYSEERQRTRCRNQLLSSCNYTTCSFWAGLLKALLS